MKLYDLVYDFDDIDVGIAEKTRITGICQDSRIIEPGNVFVCIKGDVTDADGHRFAQMAAQKGASAIISQDEIHTDIPVIYVEDTKIALAKIASRYFGEPEKKLKILGITGTNGKTTNTYLIKTILESAGYKVGLIGTNQNMIGETVYETHNTTPLTLELFELFSKMVQENVDYVVMEVSSHALSFKRVHGINFEVAAFTNLTQEHLDYYRDMNDYFSAKAQLFEMSKKAVINIDDTYGKKLIMTTLCNARTFGITENAYYKAQNITNSAKGISFTIDIDNKKYDFSLSMPGIFSVYNALTAIGVCHQAGIAIENIQKGLLLTRGVKGRAETLNIDKDYTILIDYSHTPDSLENILSTIKGFATGRIVTVFGCGGDRDKTKRPIMGKIAGKLSDFVVVTSDNPRSEEPTNIIIDILKGIKETVCPYTAIQSRREAIKYAIENAQKDDVILLAGKGHETYQILKHETIDFDERKIVNEILAELDN